MTDPYLRLSMSRGGGVQLSFNDGCGRWMMVVSNENDVISPLGL